MMADDLGPSDDGLGPPTPAALPVQNQDDDLGPSVSTPPQNQNPDTSAMKDYVSKNIDAYKNQQAGLTQPNVPPKKTYAQGFGEALMSGLQTSSLGWAIHGEPTTVLPENAGRAMRLMSQAGQMIGDTPAFLAGSVAAGGPETPAGLAAGFSAPMAIRKMLMDHYEKGDIQSPSDFVDRLMGTAWEATKGAVTGYATALAGPAAEAVGGTMAKVAAELGTMTTMGSAMEGHLPTTDEFLDGALLLGGIHGVAHIAPKLRNIYAQTGDRPTDILQEAAKNVELKQDLISPDPNTPENAQPTDMKITAQAVEAPEGEEPKPPTEPPKIELSPRNDGKDVPPVSNVERTPEEQSILDKIGVSKEAKDKSFGEKSDDWYARNIDYLDPIKSALQEAKANGAEITDNAYEMGRRFAAHTDTVRSFMEFGTRDGETGEINGEGLNKILKDVPGEDLDGYRAYGIAKRAIELDDRGITPYDKFDRATAEKVVNDGAGKYDQINQRRVDFENRVLDFAQKKGLLNEDQLESIKSVNENHFAFNRVQDPDLYTGEVRGGSALKKIYGSDAKLLDPILQTYKNTEALVKKALINDVRTTFIDSMRDGGLLEEDGKENPEAYLTEVKKQNLPIEVTSQELAKGLEKQGFEGIDPDSLTIFRPENTFLKDNQIQVMVDGSPKIYEGPPGVIDALKRMDGDFTSIDTWSKVMRGFANATRVGVIANPGFGLSHFFRSQIMSSVYSETGMIPFFHSAMAIKELMGASSKDYQDWVYHGGASSSWLRMDDNYLKDNAIEANEKEAPIHGRAWNAIHNAMEATEGFIKLTDNASRFAEYKRSLAEGTTPEEAAFRSREVVPDYQKVGLERSALRTGVAFIGAHINSLDRMKQAFQEDPKSTIARLSVISAVSAMLWAANKDDDAIQSLPNWQKDQYWNINVTRATGGGGPNQPATILKLPKPWAPGILFGSGVEAALDSFTKDSPSRIPGFIHTLSTSVVPEPIPNIAQPVLEQWANKNRSTGRPLVNEGLEKQLPEMQYAPYTSQSAKQIAKLIGYVPFVKDVGPKGENVPLSSPLVVENYIRTWGGTVGGWALKIADQAITQEKQTQVEKNTTMSSEEKAQKISALGVDRAEPWQNTAILHSFVTRYPSFNSQDVQDFYDNKQKADQVLNSIHSAAKSGDIEKAQMIAEIHPDLTFKLDGTAKAISTAKKTYQAIQDDPNTPAVEKRQLLDTILFHINDMAKQGNRMISDFKKQARGTMGQGE